MLELSNIGLYALRAIQADDNELDRFAKVIVNNDDLLEVLVRLRLGHVARG